MCGEKLINVRNLLFKLTLFEIHKGVIFNRKKLPVFLTHFFNYLEMCVKMPTRVRSSKLLLTFLRFCFFNYVSSFFCRSGVFKRFKAQEMMYFQVFNKFNKRLTKSLSLINKSDISNSKSSKNASLIKNQSKF